MSEPNGRTDPNGVEDSTPGVFAGPGLPKAPLEEGNNILAQKCSELPNGGLFKNGANFLKNKNYKAGSKINQLADMLAAKRSQSLLQVQQPGTETEVSPVVEPAQEQVPLSDPSPKREDEETSIQLPNSPPPLPLVESRLQPPATPPNALDDYENSTKVRVVKTRTSPRCKTEVEPQQTDSVVKRGKTKLQRRSKKLVEMSTQTADIQFISILTETKSPLPLSSSQESHTFVCLYCHTTFSERRDCKNHELSHSQKRKTKFIKCQFCPKKLPNLDEFKLHATKAHSSHFHVCQKCDIRFVDEEKLIGHCNLEHPPQFALPSEQVSDKIDKPTVLNTKKLKCNGPALNIDVSFDGAKKTTPSPRSCQRLSPRERTDEQYEAEMLFYSHLSGNIQENLSKHLDGKIDQTDSNNLTDSNDPIRSRNGNLLSVVSSSATAATICRAPSPYQTRSKTPNPLPTSAKKFKKLPNWQQKFWEKYNFPTNYRYEHRFWDKNYLNMEKSSLYLKDLSSLDIKTQLTMRQNAKKLEESSSVENNEVQDHSFPYLLNLTQREVIPNSSEPESAPKTDVLTVPVKKGKAKPPRRSRLSAQGQVLTRQQSVGDTSRQRKGSLDLTTDKKMTLRRQTSLENIDVNKSADVPSTPSQDAETSETLETSIISGEWVRPRTYLCGVCYSRFDNLWELEDHKFASHPNVYCSHYEFSDEKLEKVFKFEMANPPIKLPDLYRRHLETTGILDSARATSALTFPHPCSKCMKPCSNQPELHKHMLECGGDTSWFLTIYSSPSNMKRKWRPFGTKRRKQTCRRGLKRSAPATPSMKNYCSQPKVRTKPGDVESIQKMLANLPEKRTRRAINFDEINTRSQATIHSNRLLRKRLNSTFTSNFLRKQCITRMRQAAKPLRRDLNKLSPEVSSKTNSASSSKSTSDVSTDSTPISSPRRRIKLKDPPSIVANPLAVGDVQVKSEDSKIEPISTDGPQEGKKRKKTTLQKKKVQVVKGRKESVLPSKQRPTLKLPKNKTVVKTKAEMVKKIKRKLRTSRKLLEERQEKKKIQRRSGRVKFNQLVDGPGLPEPISNLQQESTSEPPSSNNEEAVEIEEEDLQKVESVKEDVGRKVKITRKKERSFHGKEKLKKILKVRKPRLVVQKVISNDRESQNIEKPVFSADEPNRLICHSEESPSGPEISLSQEVLDPIVSIATTKIPVVARVKKLNNLKKKIKARIKKPIKKTKPKLKQKPEKRSLRSSKILKCAEPDIKVEETESHGEGNTENLFEIKVDETLKSETLPEVKRRVSRSSIVGVEIAGIEKESPAIIIESTEALVVPQEIVAFPKPTRRLSRVMRSNSELCLANNIGSEELSAKSRGNAVVEELSNKLEECDTVDNIPISGQVDVDVEKVLADTSEPSRRSPRSIKQLEAREESVRKSILPSKRVVKSKRSKSLDFSEIRHTTSATSVTAIIDNGITNKEQLQIVSGSSLISNKPEVRKGRKKKGKRNNVIEIRKKTGEANYQELEDCTKNSDLEASPPRFPRRCKLKAEEKSELENIHVSDNANPAEDLILTTKNPSSPTPQTRLELSEMPILEKAEPVDIVKENIVNDDLPVLKPFEDGEVDHTMVRFKIVKKAKKSSSKIIVSPLKIVKEKAPVSPEGVKISRKRKIVDLSAVEEERKQAQGKKKVDTEDSSSDCEPLSKFQKEPDEKEVACISRTELKKPHLENKKKPKKKTRQSNNKTTKGVNEANEDLIINGNVLPSISPPNALDTCHEQDNISHELEISKEEATAREMQEAVMVKIITDKLNDAASKKRRESGHKRAKKHDLKRLRMTVTLKEATLKVLDKPATPLNPNKWTVSPNSNDQINFEVPPIVDLSSKSFIVGESATDIDIKAADEGTMIQSDSNDVKSLIQEEEISKVDSDLQIKARELIEIPESNNACIAYKNTQEKDATNASVLDDLAKSEEVHWQQPLPRLRKKSRKDIEVAHSKNYRRRSGEEVTTTVEVPEEEKMPTQEFGISASSSHIPEVFDNPKPESEDNKVDCNLDTTLVEVTSSEDGLTEKVLVSDPQGPKIAEADSSAMIDEDTSIIPENHEAIEDEVKVEMDALVSSSESSVQKPKRRSEAVVSDSENKEEVPSTTLTMPEELDRRSRRRNKEIPTSNEFVVDDPLILIDELWSDLDSDSDSKPKLKVKRVKKRVDKKKMVSSDVDLEALLRNFGANKSSDDKDEIKRLRKKVTMPSTLTSRQRIERKITCQKNTLKRLSLRLFSFHKKVLQDGHRGGKLLHVKKILMDSISLHKLTLLISEVTENPEQVIVCRARRTKAKKSLKTTETRQTTISPPQLKVSLPLDLIGDISLLNNNNSRDKLENIPEASIVEDDKQEVQEVKMDEPKTRRSDVIDKIFSCDICKTYYYSFSQLKNHKMSNRHKLKEAEVLEGGSEEAEVPPNPTVAAPATASATDSLDVDKASDDTSEMPVLEGPFIEVKGTDSVLPPKKSFFGFSEESLKDIQKAIGFTDEEMLLLTILGENAAEEQGKIQENEAQSANLDSTVKNVKSNGSLENNLKQRMTSALANIVNRAVNNLLKKSEDAGTLSEKSTETANFLSLLTALNNTERESRSTKKRKEPATSDSYEEGILFQQPRYKYQCRICGNRFEKESTRDYHLVRTHHRQRSKPSATKSSLEELTPPSDDWSDSWMDIDEPCMPSSQFWCSECGINFTSPKEVREHQRIEHPPSAAEDSPRVRTPLPKRSEMDPAQEKLLANQELQKLRTRKYSSKLRGRKTLWGTDGVKFSPTKSDKVDIANTPKISPNMDTSESGAVDTQQGKLQKVIGSNTKRKKAEISDMELPRKPKKSMDVYDFDSESEGEPVVLSHVRKPTTNVNCEDGSDEDSEDNLPLSTVKTPMKKTDESQIDKVIISAAEEIEKNVEELSLIAETEKIASKELEEQESFKISLESRLICLEDLPLKKPTPPATLVGEEEDSRTLDDAIPSQKDESSANAVLETSWDILTAADSDNELNDNVIFQRNDSVSSYGSDKEDEEDNIDDDDDAKVLSESDPNDDNLNVEYHDSSKSGVEEDDEDSHSDGMKRTKKIVPLLSATLPNNIRKSESPKLNKEVIVKKIWSRQHNSQHDTTDESQSSEIDKDTIMKRIWRKKRAEAEGEEEKVEEIKINQTEVSDEVVIKCGPKTKPINRRKAINETAKDVIVRRIWSGKCGFQTKAALKTYDSDLVPAATPAKRRGRPPSLSNAKRKKVVSASEDDLDSLLDEIEQENVEKAIRLQILHLRRSDKTKMDHSSEPSGLFTEKKSTVPVDKRKKKIRRNVRVLKRREDNAEMRNRKHKRHRHRHHQHHHKKHKHKKSRHHKKILSKHRSKHRENAASGGFQVLERMCEDIAVSADSGLKTNNFTPGEVLDSRVSADLDNLDSKIDEVLSPLVRYEKRVNGIVNLSEVFSSPSEDDSNQCSSNKGP